MNINKPYYYSLFISLAICILVLADAYICPTKSNPEIVMGGRASLIRGWSSASYSYTVQTANHKYYTTGDFYNNVDKGDTIIIKRSAVTSALLQISIVKGKSISTYDEGALKNIRPVLLTVIIIIAIICMLLFLAQITNQRAKLVFTILLSALAFSVLLSHMGFLIL